MQVEIVEELAMVSILLEKELLVFAVAELGGNFFQVTKSEKELLALVDKFFPLPCNNF